MLSDALQDLREGLRAVFAERELRVHFSWEVSGRSVSETGGRLLEDFVLSRINEALHSLPNPRYSTVSVVIPKSGRDIEDFRVVWSRGETKWILLVDIKGHNEYRPGARPNLASLRKCLELYSDADRVNYEVVIFYCRYRPSIRPEARGSEVTYTVLPSSFGDAGVFPLRFLSKSNLDPANIGSGGQILLAREERLVLEHRSRQEFVCILNGLKERLTPRG